MERKDNCFMRGMVSQRTVNPSPKGIVGSNPTEAANIALVAQLAERLICNQDVGSSILLGGTKVCIIVQWISTQGLTRLISYGKNCQ